MSPSSKKVVEELTYEAAFTELETIVKAARWTSRSACMNAGRRYPNIAPPC